MKRIVSLYLPTWPTDRLRRNGLVTSPEPLATLHRDGSHRLIGNADKAARRLGIKPGMPILHAQALHPGLTIVDADPRGDRRDLHGLGCLCIRRWSPLVYLDGSDGLFLDVTGCAHLHGSERAMLEEIGRTFMHGGVTVRLAIADSCGAAHGTARHHPDALCIVPAGNTIAILDDLPIAALRLPLETVDGLRRLGLSTIGQIRALPQAPLARRFGIALVRRLHQALGEISEPMTPIEINESIRVDRRFAEPVSNPDYLARVVEELAAELALRLEREVKGARTLDLVFQRIDGEKQAVRVGTSRPSRDPRHFARLFRDRLDRIDPGFGIEALTLIATAAEDQPLTQIESEAGDGQEADLAELVDRLRVRLGEEAVYRLAPTRSDLPERAVQRIDPLKRVDETWLRRAQRPMHLLTAPEPVATIALLPDYPPSRFVWRKKTRKVIKADGPERIVGEWWVDPAELHATRDYFLVEDEEGYRYWLFRDGNGVDPRTGSMRWFLHGFFA